MAVKVRQSFEGKDTDHGETWTNTSVDFDYFVPVDTNGRRPPGCGAECQRANCTVGANAYNGRVAFSDTTGGYFRGYFLITSASFSADGNKCIVSARNSAANAVYQIQLFSTSGQLNIQHRYHDGSLIYASGQIDISLNVWYRIEVQYMLGGTTTWLKIYDLDGNQVGSSLGATNMTGARTDMADIAVGWVFAGNNFSSGVNYFDLVEYSQDGWVGASSEQTTISKMTLRPASDSATINWTPVGGSSHYALLDDDPVNDATYIYSSGGTSVADWLNFQLSGTGETVNSANKGVPLLVKPWLRAKCITGGTPTKYYRHISFCMRWNGTNYYYPNSAPTIPEELDLYGMMVKEDSWDWYGIPFDEHVVWSGISGDTRWTWYDYDTFGATAAPRWGVWNDAGEVAGVGNWQSGGMVSEMKVEIFYGSRNHRLISCPPMFGAVTDTSIKMRVRIAKPWENPSDTRVRVRYSLNADMYGASTSTSQTPSSADDYCCTFDITGLRPNTRYYFDVDTSGDAGTTWLTMGLTEVVDWATTGYPSCKTFPASHSLEPFSFMNFTDRHHIGASEAYVDVRKYDSLFSLCFGDIVENLNDDAGETQTKQRAQRILRGSFGDMSNPYMRDVAKHSPIFGVWDDHDFMHNDSYGESEPYKAGSRDAFLDYRPTPPPGSGNTNYQYGLWHDFKVGKLAHFIVLDVHYMSNDVGIIGGDHLDGTGSNTSSIYTSTNSHTSQYKLIKSGINFYDQGVRIGHVVKNSSTTEWAIVKAFESTYGSNDTLVLWWPINYNITSAITGTQSALGTGYWLADSTKDFKALGIRKNMEVVNITDGYSWCRVERILTTTNPNDTLDTAYHSSNLWDDGDQYRIYELKDIFRSTGQTFVIYPSGGEDYGSKAANEAEGHYQREWLVDTIKKSDCIWKVIVASVTWNRQTYANGEDKFSYHDHAQALYWYVYNSLRDVRNVLILTGDRHISWIDTGVNCIFPECNSSPAGADFQSTEDAQCGVHDIGVYGSIEFIADGFDFDNYCRNFFGLFKVTSKAFEMQCIDQKGVPKVTWTLPYRGKSPEVRRSFAGRRTTNLYRSRR